MSTQVVQLGYKDATLPRRSLKHGQLIQFNQLVQSCIMLLEHKCLPFIFDILKIRGDVCFSFFFFYKLILVQVKSGLCLPRRVRKGSRRGQNLKIKFDLPRRVGKGVKIGPTGQEPMQDAPQGVGRGLIRSPKGAKIKKKRICAIKAKHGIALIIFLGKVNK